MGTCPQIPIAVPKGKYPISRSVREFRKTEFSHGALKMILDKVLDVTASPSSHPLSMIMLQKFPHVKKAFFKLNEIRGF